MATIEGPVVAQNEAQSTLRGRAAKRANGLIMGMSIAETDAMPGHEFCLLVGIWDELQRGEESQLHGINVAAVNAGIQDPDRSFSLRA